MSGISRLRHVAAMDPPGRGSISTEEARGVLAELDVARARLAALEAELAKVKGYQRELAERCARKDLELDEWRTGGSGAGQPLTVLGAPTRRRST